MESEIQLLSDGDGLAVIGSSKAVEQFLAAERLQSRDLSLPRLSAALSAGGAIGQASSEIAASSGRWVKLTKESVAIAKKHGLRESSTSGLSTGVVKGTKGQIKGFVEFSKGPGSALTNPAILAGAAGVMAQLAMQQTMDEITDYLAEIDEKLDNVMRAQTNQVLARMDGADLAIREAMSIRESVGGVSDITWSKVQATSTTVLDTQAYALRQLGDLAEKMERIDKVGDLVDATKEAELQVHQWLAVLARCFKLQDAIAVLELDRVLNAAPEDLDRHRRGLKAARQDRLALISTSTERLLSRMHVAANRANSTVLVNPFDGPTLVAASNNVSESIVVFHGLLGVERGWEAVEARRWKSAASEAKDRAIGVGADHLDTARRASAETLGKARWASGRASDRVSTRMKSWRGIPDEGSDDIGDNN